MYKTAASAAQLENLHFASCLLKVQAACGSQKRAQITSSCLCYAYLTSWHNKNIFGTFNYKLRTNYEQLKLKILKKLRTVSFNSKFIGSYKKCVSHSSSRFCNTKANRPS